MPQHGKRYLAGVGADGRAYDPAAVSGRPQRVPSAPRGTPRVYASKGVRKALRLLQGEPYGGLDSLQEAKLVTVLQDIIRAAEDMLAEISDDGPGGEDDGHE